MIPSHVGELRGSFMPSASQRARTSLQALTYAADVLYRADPTNVLAREAAFRGVSRAASDDVVAANFFEKRPEYESEKDFDWLSVSMAAALEVRSAHVLLGVAALHGELEIPVGVPKSQMLQEALASARNEVGRLNVPTGRADFQSPGALVPVPDIDTAVDNFRSAADAAISQITNESEKVISATFDEIKKHSASIRDALSALSDLQSLGGTLAGFVAKAWERLRSAIAFLTQIAASVSIDTLNDYLKQIKDKISVRSGIEAVYEVSKWRSTTKVLHPRSDLTIRDLDDHCRQMSELSASFARLGSTLRATMLGFSVVAGLIAAHLTGPLAVLLLPAANVAVASVVIVAGLTYFGELRLGTNVRDIRGIEESIAGSRLS